jgi:hypothetical protein
MDGLDRPAQCSRLDALPLTSSAKRRLRRRRAAERRREDLGLGAAVTRAELLGALAHYATSSRLSSTLEVLKALMDVVASLVDDAQRREDATSPCATVASTLPALAALGPALDSLRAGPGHRLPALPGGPPAPEQSPSPASRQPPLDGAGPLPRAASLPLLACARRPLSPDAAHGACTSGDVTPVPAGQRAVETPPRPSRRGRWAARPERPDASLTLPPLASAFPVPEGPANAAAECEEPRSDAAAQALVAQAALVPAPADSESEATRESEDETDHASLGAAARENANEERPDAHTEFCTFARGLLSTQVAKRTTLYDCIGEAEMGWGYGEHPEHMRCGDEMLALHDDVDALMDYCYYGYLEGPKRYHFYRSAG